MESNPAFNSLIQMGCNPILCQAAIRNLKTEDLSALLDWISEHAGEQQKWGQWLSQNKEPEGQKIQGGAGGASITHLINKEFSEQLQKKGHTKAVAEKSLLLTSNASIESAQAWIDQHKFDPDFEEELMLEGQAFQESSLTDEEAKERLKQLTEKARENRKKREQQEERERQKNRVRYGKEMIEAKRIAEQQAMKRQLQLDRIQKRKDEEYKQKLVEQMRRQRNEKLGIKEEPGVQTKAAKKEEPTLSMLEQLQVQCEQVKVGMHAYPDRARVFFETAQIYINNIIKNNGEEKFRKINKENKAFQSRIMECFGGVETLEVIGYEEDNGFLVMKKFDLNNLAKVSDILARYKGYY